MRHSMFRFTVLTVALVGLVVLPSALAEQGGNQGQKFQLFGGAQDAFDPDNPTNEVVRFVTTATQSAGARRDIFKRNQVSELDNQVQLKYRFTSPKNCAAGSPRIQLRIDPDGTAGPMPPRNAFGYVGELPFGAGCVPIGWHMQDMTDAVGRWDVSQFGGPQALTWDLMELFFANPNHEVLRGALVEDPSSGGAIAGTAHYDNLVIGNRTLNDHSDTAGK